MPLRLASLIAYLDAHGNHATVTADGDLAVLTPYSDGWHVEVIATTWNDVRAHLGY